MSKKNLFPVLLIIFGSFLEVYYYAFRFYNDGIPVWLSIVIGVALTLLLAMAVNQRTWAIVVPVAIYSIMATSAGQSFSLSEKVQAEIQEESKNVFILEEIEDLESQIDWLDGEISRLSAGVAETASNTQDRAWWGKYVKADEERIENYRQERRGLAEKLSTLRSGAVVHSEVKKPLRTTIYDFYSDLFAWPADWLQFIFQTVLSGFIALMAPLGILAIKKPVEKPEKFDRWKNLSFVGIRTGKSDKLLSKEAFFSFIKKNKEDFTQNEYNRCLEYAIDRGLVKRSGKIIQKSIDK